MIQIFNRVTQKVETETVFGEKAISLAYGNRLGRALTENLFSKQFVSRLMGAYYDSAVSRRDIAGFVKNYHIPMNEFEFQEYANFNEFFIRKFKAGVRPFSEDARVFSAGAEARYLAFQDLKKNHFFPVKGIEIDLPSLLKNDELGRSFEGGTLLIARLCPVDYHRFHFPVDGLVTHYERVPGVLHSVNPVAFTAHPKLLMRNEREVSIIENEAFGRVAMIEVGALGVGKIVQSAFSNRSHFPFPCKKGQEKGYFLFGGSTVLFIFQKGNIKLSQDLVDYSAKGMETWIPLGGEIGLARPNVF